VGVDPGGGTTVTAYCPKVAPDEPEYESTKMK
jgi:hypothetical protein